MNDIFERLTNQLLSKNSSLSYAQARTWVELFWEDFESSYAKAGYDYKGKKRRKRLLRCTSTATVTNFMKSRLKP